MCRSAGSLRLSKIRITKGSGKLEWSQEESGQSVQLSRMFQLQETRELNNTNLYSIVFEGKREVTKLKTQPYIVAKGTTMGDSAGPVTKVCVLKWDTDKP